MKKQVTFLIILVFIFTLIGCENNKNSEIQVNATLNTSEDTTLSNTSEEEIFDISNIIEEEVYTPESIIYGFLEGIYTVNFPLSLIKTIDGYMSQFEADPLVERYKNLASLNYISENMNSLIFGLLADENLMNMSGKNLNDEEYEYLLECLNPRRLQDIKIIDIFTPDDSYIDEIKTKFGDLDDERIGYRVAICEFEAKYFSIAFQFASFTDILVIVDFWDGYNLNEFTNQLIHKTNTLDDFSTYFGFDFDSTRYYSLDENQVNYYDYAVENLFGLDRVSNEFFKYFITPEDAIEAYVNGLKNNDMKEIIGASAAILKAKNYDLRAKIDYLNAYMVNSKDVFPDGFDYYTSIRECDYISEYIRESFLSLIYLLSDETKNVKMQVLVDRLDPLRMKDLEIVEIFTPNAAQNDQEDMKQLMVKQAKVVGASDKCEKVAILKFEEQYCACAFTLLKFDQNWKIDSFSIYSTLPLGNNLTSLKTDDISYFDELR